VIVISAWWAVAWPQPILFTAEFAESAESFGSLVSPFLQSKNVPSYFNQWNETILGSLCVLGGKAFVDPKHSSLTAVK
jgi:hypothetical protein